MKIVCGIVSLLLEDIVNIFQYNRVTSILLQLSLLIYTLYIYNSITISSATYSVYLHWTEEGSNDFVHSFSLKKLLQAERSELHNPTLKWHMETPGCSCTCCYERKNLKPARRFMPNNEVIWEISLWRNSRLLNDIMACLLKWLKGAPLIQQLHSIKKVLSWSAPYFRKLHLIGKTEWFCQFYELRLVLLLLT